jgi:hypothetical protein
MQLGYPKAPEEPSEGLGGLRESGPERRAADRFREQVVAPNPDSVWAETSSIMEIEAEPPEEPRWIKSS